MLQFINCLSRISNTQVDNAHNINVVMAIYNLTLTGMGFLKVVFSAGRGGVNVTVPVIFSRSNLITIQLYTIVKQPF